MTVKDRKLQLCTAAAPEGEPAAILKAIREAGQTFQACIAGLEDILEEPLKGKFVEVKNQINTMLAGLPDTDKVPAALASNDVLQRLLGVLSAAQMMISSLDETAKSARSQLASTRASMPEEIRKAIEAQIASGDLVPKAVHEKAITDATAAATSAAHEAAKAEITLLNSRRQILATASLPVPEDKLLTGDDKAFEAKKTAAAKRLEDLKPYKFLPAERVLSLCWLETDEAFTGTLALIKTATEAATASVKSGANPFINRPAADNQPSRKPVTGVC